MVPFSDLSTIRLLGRPGLVAGGQRVPIAPKLAQLLAYLALSETRTASRSDLADLLWQQVPDARANLRQLLARARREDAILARLLVAEGPDIRLCRDPAGLDIDALSDLLESGAACDPGQVAPLFSSVLLEEISDTTSEFEDWLRTARGQIAGQLTALAERILRTSEDHPASVLVAAARFLTDERAESGRQTTAAAHLIVEAFARARRPDLARLYAVPQAPQPAPERPAPVAPLRLGFRALDTSLLTDTSLPLRAFIEDCTDHLAAYRSFVTMAPHSTMRPDGVASDLSVTGGVRQGKRGPVLALRLEEADGAIRWAGRFDVDAEALVGSAGTLVRRVAADLADAVEAKISETMRLAGRPDAFAAYLAGRSAMRNCDLPSIRRARRHFQEAAKADPDFAAPRAAMGETLCLEWVLRGGRDPDLLAAAHAAADAARQIDPGAAAGHWVSGTTALYRRETDRVLAHFADAEALAPNCADLLLEHADALSHLEDHDAAQARFRRSLDLNPAPPDHYWWTGASIAFGRRDFDEAVKCCARLESDEAALPLRAACYAMAGQLGQARRWARRARATLPETRIEDLIRLTPDRPDGQKIEDYRAGLALAGFV